ncbi:hypothetical protein BJY04DRAFT_203357 [Aspergillus karnatakaensis]|uniref:uncharacterized protein n=1 Tax=Aspergillus karnatakaensis TaxID=1810916 RepID=UPI003CCE44B4
MQRAIEQAGSVFTGWISSCLFYLDSGGDDDRSRHQQAMKQKGAEREMQICHSQPHLVPPMKLVVYDDLPNPGPPRASSFPTRVMEEGRNLASRASSRVRKSTAPVRISAPTDFRRVTTLPTISTVSSRYRPLELNFQSPANPLPDLPRFEFGFEQDHSHQAPLARPPRALSTMTDFSYQSRSRTHRPSSSFHLPRKPVGSGSRRSSLATLELLMERQVPISHPLIPHFSTRSSTASLATGLAPSVHTSPPTWPDSIVGSPSFTNVPSRVSHDAAAPPIPSIPKPPTPQDKSLPPVPTKTPRSSGHHYYEPPATPVDNVAGVSALHPSPSRSSRVTQWLLQTSTSLKTSTDSPQHPRKPSLSDKLSMRLRSRTLSGSTLASYGNTISAPGGLKAAPTTPTPPLSHTITPATTMTLNTARTSTLDSRYDKDFEMPYTFAPRQTHSSSFSDEHARTHPTIYEAQQQQQQHSLDNSFDFYTHDHHRHSTIGVAY